MVHLNEKGLAILGHAHLRADQSHAQVAKVVGCHEETVRRFFQRLEDDNLVRRFPLVNYYALGYQEFSLYFALEGASSVSQSELLSELVRVPGALIVQSLGGGFDFSVTILGRTGHDLAFFIAQLAHRQKLSINQRVANIVLGQYFFERNFLVPSRSARDLIALEPTIGVSIDELDCKILHAFSSRREATKANVARHLGIPATTLDYRLQKLERDGVIRAWVYYISTKDLGLQVYKILVGVKTNGPEFRKKLIEVCAKSSSVVSLLECVGSWDYEVVLECKANEAVTEFTWNLGKQFENQISTRVVVSVLNEQRNWDLMLQRPQVKSGS